MRDPFEFAGICRGGGRRDGLRFGNIKVNARRHVVRVLLDGQDITMHEDRRTRWNSNRRLRRYRSSRYRAATSRLNSARSPAPLQLHTKSGTNGLHGVAFTFVRNEDLNAAKPTPFRRSADQHTSPYRGQELCGGIGGPWSSQNIQGRNKTFSLPTGTVPDFRVEPAM